MKGSREKIQIPEGHSFRVLRWNRSLREVACILGPGQSVKIAGEGTHWHFHPEMELTLFISGEGTRFVGDHMGPFEAGDLLLLGGRLPHHWHTGGPTSGISLQWHFPQSHPFWSLPETLEMMELFKRADRGILFTGGTSQAAAGMLQEIGSVSGTMRLSHLLHVFALLTEAPKSEFRLLSQRSFAITADSHYQQAIARSIRHLIANFRESVRLEDVLKLTALSRPTFARQFKQHAGLTFSAFLNRLRLQAACQALAESNQSVMEIALACGFTQISFFNRLFRRTQGCSPSVFRQRQQVPRKGA